MENTTTPPQTESLALLAESTQQCVRVADQIKALMSALERLHHSSQLSAVVMRGQQMAMLAAIPALENLLGSLIYGNYMFELTPDEPTSEKRYAYSSRLGV